MEKWADISGYEGIYKISDSGIVKSISRITPHGHFRKEIIMSLETDKYGYLKVGLTRGGVQKRFLVSRIVASHFIQNDHNKPTVNHIDGNKKNNHFSNLEWATVKEQNHHAVMNNLMPGYVGSKNPNSKLSEKDVRKIRQRIKKGLTIKKIAIEFNVSWSLVGLIKQGRVWKHVS